MRRLFGPGAGMNDDPFPRCGTGWSDGRAWTYHLVRGGRGEAYEGRLTYTLRRLDDGGWRVDGVSDYPAGRSLREWLELRGTPVRQAAAFFERRNAAGVYRYEAAQAPDGSLRVREESAAAGADAPMTAAPEEQHSAAAGPVYLANQLDFLLHGLDLDADGPWPVRLRVEGGKVHAFEIRLVAREAPLTSEGETVPATLVTLRPTSNPLLKRLAPPTRYWFHPRDQTMLLRIDHADTVLTLVGFT